MPASLHDALDQREWCLEEIRQILRDDSSLINEERQLRTPLHRVLMDQRCSVDIVQLLLYYGADANRRMHVPRRRGISYTPLSMVIRYCSAHRSDIEMIEVLRALVEGGAKVDQTDNWSLRDAVIMNADPEIIRLLVKAGADLLRPNFKEEPLLFRALKFFDVKAFGSMLDLLDVDINSIRNGEDETLLHSALSIPGCTTEFVEFLIDRGIDVNSVDLSGKSPLHLANTLDIVGTLLKRGAIVIALDDSGKTSLDQAIHLDYDSDVIKLLLKYFLLENPNFNLDYRAQRNLQGRMIEEYGNDCKRELQGMSSEIVGIKRTLLQFLQTYPVCQMQSNGENGFNFDHLLKLIIEIKYPLYTDVIGSKFGHTLLKPKLEDCHVRTVVRSRTGVKKEISLNTDCISVVAKYLKRTDLLNMIVAFHK